MLDNVIFKDTNSFKVFAVGDVVGHAIPPSGQTAIWSGGQCVEEIAHRLHGKSYTLKVKSAAQNASNVCFSMVGDKPEEAIRVYHDFSWDPKKNIIVGKGRVPKAADGKNPKVSSV